MSKGFTLVEIIIYLGIISVLVSSFVMFSVFISFSRNKVYVVEELQANIRFALDLISQKVRAADSVVLPNKAGTGDTLILDMPQTQPNLTFSLQDGVLGITEEGGSFLAITSQRVLVSSILFSNLSEPGRKDNIRVEATFEYKGNESVEFSFQQTAQTSITNRN